RPQHQQQQWLQ
ncbi:hypothetical protein BN1723_020897, partial [Verticillium longisporum]